MTARTIAFRTPDEIETALHQLREAGCETSLIDYEYERDVYCFTATGPAADAFKYECCDGTGWTGRPTERCTVHYEPARLP